ncbi:MAG TPA: HYR domain-containing protein, partial [Verrucomicrobiae bacterium]|nr:HYR domain-containing protein [Verrucomicrobiae bacterium]
VLDGNNGLCTSVASYNPTVRDNCPGTIVNCVPPSGTSFPPGTNHVTCTGIDAAGNMVSCVFSVINRLQPLAATPPQSQTRCAGEVAVFATSATGSGPMTFAWFKEGVLMSGRTNISLALSNITPADSGTYGVRVQTPCGSVSNSATLTVRPLVTVNGLTNVTKCDCDPLVLSPTVSGTGPYSYLWRKNGSIIAGATSNTLVFSKLTTNDAGLYTVEVSGPCNTASASAGVGVIHVVNPAVYTNSGTITIYDNAPAFPYPSSVRVACVPDTVKRATVTLRGFTHSYPDDVDVMLATPDGRCVMLMSDVGSGSLANNINITLDDSAAAPLPDSTQLVTGTFRPANYDSDSDNFPAPAPKLTPVNNLTGLAGIDPNGFWSLFVVDDFQLDTGVINNGWVLRLYWESNPARITTTRMLWDGTFQMTLIGDPQTTYMIEASPDMRTWEAIGSVTLTGAQGTFTDPAPNSPRFYRAVQR